MADIEFVLTKFDVAERQLRQAIRLFFDEGDPVSVHTLAEAAVQVFRDIGGKSMLRDSEMIRTDKRGEWLKALATSRNFFKHADRDKDEVHEFKQIFNHFSLLDACLLLAPMKKSWTPETMAYWVWFSATYPDLLVRTTDDDERWNRFVEYLPSLAGATLTSYKEMIRTLLRSPPAGIQVGYGLPP